MTGELLSTVDAFRFILRSKYPEREDLQKIDSYRWFHERQRIEISKHVEISSPFDGVLVAPQNDQPAYEALRLLRDAVASGKIRLHGILKTELPADVDPIHACEGDLDVFAGTLTFEQNDIFNSKTVYTRVHCYAKNLAEVDGDERPAAAPTRYPGDAALLEEGRRMLAAGKQKRAVARELAPRAEGNATLESKIDRLRKAL